MTRSSSRNYSIARLTPVLAIGLVLLLSLEREAAGAATVYGTQSRLAVSTSSAFCNTQPIIINHFRVASPYASEIIVSGLPGVVAGVTVEIKDFRHNFADDVDMMLVGPEGHSTILMSDAAGHVDVRNLDLTFQDGAPPVPDSSPPPSGTYKPTNYEQSIDEFPKPPPVALQSPTLSIFNGTKPEGVWGLYIVDDFAGFSGAIEGGWCVNITTGAPTASSVAR